MWLSLLGLLLLGSLDLTVGLESSENVSGKSTIPTILLEYILTCD